ncbi:MAG: DUF6929 family protein [Caldimonas sp.]
MSLTYRPIRTLTTDPAAHPRGLPFLSAASGLVRVGARLYVVLDDENHLGVFAAQDAAPVRLIRLFAGDLPDSAKKRKARKADLEALLHLPAAPEWPAGALLALGSGSRPNRFAGALLRLDAQGDTDGPARAIDLAPLYAALAARLPEELNIEGAFIAGDELVLLQRGNLRVANAVVRFALAPVTAWLRGATAAPLAPVAVAEADLGAADGVPLGFTDGAALADGSWLFSAVAERSDNSYDDGACVAAAIGVVRPDGSLGEIRRLEPTRKIEGIEARSVDGSIVVGMVTDADDPATPAEFGVTRL